MCFFEYLKGLTHKAIWARRFLWKEFSDHLKKKFNSSLQIGNRVSYSHLMLFSYLSLKLHIVAMYLNLESTS